MSKACLTPWKVVATKEIFADHPYVSLSRETVELPNGTLIDDYYQVRTADFACIFAETADGRVVVLRQYKHGVRQISLTFPGGHLSGDEAPLEAAKRELFEETGYKAAAWKSLGSFVENGNQRCSVAHLFHASGCYRADDPKSGDLEEADLVLLSRAELLSEAGQGEFVVLSQLALLAIATHPDIGALRT